MPFDHALLRIEVDTPPSTRRLVGIGAVVVLHVVIIYALVSGLGEQMVQIIHPPLVADIIAQVKPPAPLPPPPPPQLAPPPPVFVPPPLVQINAPAPVGPVIAAVTNTPPPPKPVPAPVVSRAAGLDPHQTCTPPDYPEVAEDEGETGTTVLQFLIGANGRVEQSRVAQSSGHADLDQAALQALGQCHFSTALDANGKPLQAWATIPFRWTLN